MHVQAAMESMQTRGAPLHRGNLIRLAIVMSLAFFPSATWYVTLPTYISANTGSEGSGMFAPGFIGRAYMTGALGALLSPMFIGALADRFFSANRILTFLNVGCGLLCLWMPSAKSQTQLWFMMLAYCLCFSPMIGLINVICFRHLPDPIHQFPRLRALGTLSWAMGSWLVGYVMPVFVGHSIEATNLPLTIGGICHLVLAVVTLIAPATPPIRLGRSWTLRDAFRPDVLAALWQPALRWPILAMVLLTIATQFYSNFANLFLNRSQVQGAAGHLAWGQVAELGFVLLIPLAMRRLGIKWTLLLGCSGWAIRFVLFSLFASGGPDVLYWAAILLHGISFAFGYIALQMVTDRFAPPDGRTSAQGVVSMLTMGLGAFLGAQVTSLCQILYLTPPGDATPPYNWQGLWLVAAAIAACPVLLLAVAYREPASGWRGSGSPAV